MFLFGEPGGRGYAAVGTSQVNLLAWWGNGLNLSNFSVSAGSGRHDGGSSLRVGSGSNNTYVERDFTAAQTLGVAFGYRPATLPSSSTTFCGFFDGSTSQVSVNLNSDGSLALTRGGTTFATSSAALVAANTYVHLELKVKIASGTSGTYDLWVNGVNRLTSAGANTQASAAAQATNFRMGCMGGNGIVQDFDDVILYNSAATDANGFADITGPVGDRGLYWLLPTGAGTTTQWTPDTGSNFARVNEATPDGDTSFVSSSTVGQIDTYAMADLPAHVANVQALAAVHYARKDDVGARGMKSELRSAAANAAHATEIALSTSYLYYFQSWGQDPNAGTPAAWTVAAVNALELGQNLSS